MSTTCELAVIGGGIVGLAIADAYLAANPSASVIVFEKEPSLAQHASGRNSGVLHAGFYYAPDSMKARLTRHGNELLRQFCASRNVPVRPVGKVVVTTSAEQLPALRALYERGEANGVRLEMVDEAGLRSLEPLARTVGEAIWSPTTAVADPVSVVEALAGRVVERGGRIALDAHVDLAGPGWLQTTSDGYVSAGHIVNAAGLHADSVAHWFDVGRQYRMLPFKGLYWYGNWPAGRLTRHVYPVPDPRNPFLGVHLTVTVDGRAKVGPTAIPALWREEYQGLAGFSAQEAFDTARTLPRFLASPHHDVVGLLRSELPKYWRQHLIAQASALVPAVAASDFTVKGRPGVRAQLFDIERRRLEMDFVVAKGDRSTHVLNAVSPGWTSALAMAEEIVADL